MLRHVSEKSTDAILPGFVWAAIIACDCGCGHFIGGCGGGIVGVVSIVRLFGAKMEMRSERILHKSVSLVIYYALILL